MKRTLINTSKQIYKTTSKTDMKRKFIPINYPFFKVTPSKTKQKKSCVPSSKKTF